MNRLLSHWAAMAGAFCLLAQLSAYTLADSYRVNQVSDFTFLRRSGGSLDFNDAYQLGDSLFFTSSSSNGTELFRTNGNSVTEYDLNQGPGRSSIPTWHYIWRDTLYLTAFNNDLGWEMYSTSGGAPTLVADIVPGAESSSPGHHSGHAELGDYLYFFAGTQGNFGLYRTSGIGAEYIAPTSNEAPHLFNKINGSLIFVGNGEYGEEYYRTDGQTVSLLSDVNPGPAGSHPQSLFEFAGTCTSLPPVHMEKNSSELTAMP